MTTRICLIKVGALGDVVRTTALLPALKRLFPRMELTWVTGSEALPLVENNPYIRHSVTWDSPSAAPWRSAYYNWVISLDDEKTLCDLATTLRSKRLSGAHLNSNERTYTRDLEPWFGMGLLRPESQGGLRHANELKRLNSRTYTEILYDCLNLPRPIERPFIWVPAEKAQRAADWLKACRLNRPLIGLNTGAGSRWRLKSWDEARTVELAQALTDKFGASVVVLGGEAESQRNKRIEAAARRSRVRAAPTSLDLISFAGFVGSVDVLVTSDSLGLHIGAALKKPIIAFFGPTSSAEIDIFGLGERITTPLGCHTCYLRDCDLQPNCMESITVARLLEATVAHFPLSAVRRTSVGASALARLQS